MIGNVQWTIHKQDEIKPELRGKLIYLLEVPSKEDKPVVRQVIDPTGREFPATCDQALAQPEKRRAIIFEGVNKAAVYDVMLSDPGPISSEKLLEEYNRGVLENCEKFFLATETKAFSSQ